MFFYVSSVFFSQPIKILKYLFYQNPAFVPPGWNVRCFFFASLLFQNGCQGSVRSCSVSTPGVLCRSCHQISTNQYRAPNNIMFCICCVRTKNLSNNFVRTCAEYNNVISAQTVCVRTWSSLWANT